MQNDAPLQMLTYATAAKRRYRYVHAVAIILSVILLGIFYLGYVPSGAMAFDYTREIPISEVIAGVLSESPRAVLGHRFRGLVAFVSLGAVALTAFVFVRQRQPKVTISIAATLLPLLLFPKLIAFILWPPLLGLLILAPLVVPALLGQCDGETWSEGQVAYGVLLDWMLVWLTLTIVVLRSRARHAAV